jgi:hypothetical protein
MRLSLLVWVVLLAAPLAAQTDPVANNLTPRQALLQAETLFSQGHTFTADELQALDGLREQFTGDEADQAAELDLLKAGIAAAQGAHERQKKAEENWAADSQTWTDRETFTKNQVYWRGVRNTGLVLFTLATATSLVLATIADRNSALLQNGFYSDYKSRESFNNGVQVAMYSSAGIAFLSLFPLLWGEARQ